MSLKRVLELEFPYQRTGPITINKVESFPCASWPPVALFLKTVSKSFLRKDLPSAPLLLRNKVSLWSFTGSEGLPGKAV